LAQTTYAVPVLFPDHMILQPFGVAPFAAAAAPTAGTDWVRLPPLRLPPPPTAILTPGQVAVALAPLPVTGAPTTTVAPVVPEGPVGPSGPVAPVAPVCPVSP
jgi:hypothetical protein